MYLIPLSVVANSKAMRHRAESLQSTLDSFNIVFIATMKAVLFVDWIDGSNNGRKNSRIPILLWASSTLRWDGSGSQLSGGGDVASSRYSPTAHDRLCGGSAAVIVIDTTIILS